MARIDIINCINGVSLKAQLQEWNRLIQSNLKGLTEKKDQDEVIFYALLDLKNIVEKEKKGISAHDWQYVFDIFSKEKKDLIYIEKLEKEEKFFIDSWLTSTDKEIKEITFIQFSKDFSGIVKNKEIYFKNLFNITKESEQEIGKLLQPKENILEILNQFNKEGKKEFLELYFPMLLQKYPFNLEDPIKKISFLNKNIEQIANNFIELRNKALSSKEKENYEKVFLTKLFHYVQNNGKSNLNFQAIRDLIVKDLKIPNQVIIGLIEEQYPHLYKPNGNLPTFMSLLANNSVKASHPLQSIPNQQKEEKEKKKETAPVFVVKKEEKKEMNPTPVSKKAKVIKISPRDISKISETDILKENDHLFNEKDIQKIREYVRKNNLNNCRLKKAQLTGVLGYKPKFAVQVINNDISVIYYGKKHDKHLGAGAFGVTKFTVGKKGDELAEVRLQKVVVCQNPRERELAQKEAEILAATGRSHGHFWEGNKIFIDMELYSGQTLNKINFISFHHSMNAAFKITDAVKKCYDAGYVHRDLKGPNILYNQNNHTAYLVDFGMSEKMNDDKEYVDDALAGSPFYWSKELRKNKRWDEKTEVYALGITLAETLKFLKLDHDNPNANGNLKVEFSRLKLGEGYQPSPLAVTEEEKKVEKEVFDLVVKMVSDDPKVRPTLHELQTRLYSLAKEAKNIEEKKLQSKDTMVKNIKELAKNVLNDKNEKLFRELMDLAFKITEADDRNDQLILLNEFVKDHPVKKGVGFFGDISDPNSDSAAIKEIGKLKQKLEKQLHNMNNNNNKAPGKK